MAIKVTIRECYGDHRAVVVKAKTDDVNTAVERAIAKGYGAGKYFCRDYGLSVGPDALSGSQYGQIGRSVAGGTSLITGRVCIRAELV